MMASWRYMQIRAQMTAMLEASSKRISTSQRPAPFHLYMEASLGHIKAFTTLKEFSSKIQKHRTDAARLRDLKCVMPDGRQTRQATAERMGRTNARGGVTEEGSALGRIGMARESIACLDRSVTLSRCWLPDASRKTHFPGSVSLKHPGDHRRQTDSK